jgi:ribonuclease HI
MTNDSPLEWRVIDGILKTFCGATGLLINWTKSTLHYANIQEQDLDQLKAIFPHNFIHLSQGLHYLGYFIKADHYKTSDWDWLVSKVENKLGHWCYRWLSIGGRYTLIKASLEGQPVYWMALAAIPTPVLDKLRKITFNFLWSGTKDQHKQHLCNWEILASPKNKGGWGFQNIFNFSKALAANSLWRALTTKGIWSSVIKDKYFPYTSVASWLRTGSTLTRATSHTWRNLVKSAHWIQNWLCWMPGSGHSIVIGKDSITGLRSTSILSLPLIEHLNTKNIHFLYQAMIHNAHGCMTGGWKSSHELALPPDLTVEWEGYCLELTRAGIHLQAVDDHILWAGTDRTGLISVKNIYTVISNTIWLNNISGWRMNFWSWKLPLKIKLFNWLAAENKIPTWDNLQRKGWTGPNLCQLCFKDAESVFHLFNQCHFTRQVWNKIALDQHITTTWTGTSLPDCLDHWTSIERSYKHLPLLVNWFIWLARNTKIFDNKSPNANLVAYKTLGLFQNWKAIHPAIGKKKTLISPCIVEDTPTGWFDGATHRSGNLCGAGGLIRTSKNSFIRWTFCCGPGTNTRAELLGAWASLHLATILNIEHLQLIGDSRVIIDWLNHIGKLHSIALLAWMDRIRSIQCHFKKLTFTHASREYNREADLLSKTTLQKKAGLISYNQWLDGHEGPTHVIKIF